MRKIRLTVILLTITGYCALASGLKKDNLRKIRTISVASLDTANGYDKYYRIPDENLNKYFADKLDSMVSSWYVQNAFLLDSTELAEADTLKQALPDSVYIKRLQSLQSAVSLSYNPVVRNFIIMYTLRKPKQVSIMLGLANYYFPIFEEALAKYDLPMELKYLPIIESALNPEANSSASAVGLWQFMYSTARMYKLEVSTFVDERLDPIKSTDAAVRYLRDLYNIYKDWHLVIAAYNCGPGNVNKAIKRSGNKRDYWKIYYHLPRETRGYVPAFIAANYVMNFYQNHNILPQNPDFPIITDTIMVNDYLNFNQISQVLGISMDEIRTLNPQYRRDIIPASKGKRYSLVLPQDEISDYIENEKDIHDYQRDKFFPNNTIVNPQHYYAHWTPREIKGRDRVVYTIKPGDSVGLIAQWFRVRTSDLRYWNNIHHNLIRAGHRLVVYVRKGQGEYYKRLNHMTFAQKQRSLRRKPSSSSSRLAERSSQSHKSNSENDDTEYIYYKVKRGDNFWTIAKKFPGVSNYDIMRLNNITEAHSLKVGQVLKIMPKA